MEPDDEGRERRGRQDSPAPGPPRSGPERAGQFYRLAWVVYLVLAIAGLVWIGSRLGTIPLSLFLHWDTVLIDLGLGLAAGGLLIGAWIGMRRVIPSARILESELREMLGPLEPSEVVALALLSGLAEELFFRGAMQGALGWPIATLAFTILHTGPGRAFRIWTMFAGVAGLGFAGLVVWRQTLLAAIVAHVFVNGVNLTQLTRSTSSTGGEAGR